MRTSSFVRSRSLLVLDTEICDNGIDDDGDGAMDCADLDYASATTCNLCVPDVNMGTIVLGGGAKTAVVDTTTSSNRYHPACAGKSAGNPVATSNANQA